MPPPTKADANKMDDPNKYQKSQYFIIPKANFIRKHVNSEYKFPFNASCWSNASGGKIYY